MRLRSSQSGAAVLENSISLSSSLNGAVSPGSPYIPPLDRFEWKWLHLDVEKLSASFGHGEKINFVPEVFFAIKDGDIEKVKDMLANGKLSDY